MSCDRVGLQYSGAFRCLEQLTASENEAFGCVSLEHELYSTETSQESLSSRYMQHPALLDGCLQGIAALLPPFEWTLVADIVAGYQVHPQNLAESDARGPLHFMHVWYRPRTRRHTSFGRHRSVQQSTAHCPYQQIEVTQLAMSFATRPELDEITDIDGCSTDDAHWFHVEDWVPRVRVVEHRRLADLSADRLGSQLKRARVEDPLLAANRIDFGRGEVSTS